MTKETNTSTSQSSEGQPLTAENLARVAQVKPSEIGLQKYTLSAPHETVYYMPERVFDRSHHTKRLKDQIDRIEELLKLPKLPK